MTWRYGVPATRLGVCLAKIMIWNAARGGMRSVVDGYVADGFVPRHGFQLIATYGEGGFSARQARLAGGLFAYVISLAASPVELVHVHAAMRGSFWRKAVFAAIARRFGVPVVLHLHGSEMKAFYAAQPTLVKRMIVGQLEAAARVVALSESWRRFVAEIAPRAKTAVVPNAVDIADIAPTRARPARHILFLGLVGERKGVFDLLEAFALARGDKTALELTIGGNGAIERAKREALRLGVADHVDFRGWVGPQEREALSRPSRHLRAAVAQRRPADERARGDGAWAAGDHDAGRRPAGADRGRDQRPPRPGWRSASAGRAPSSSWRTTPRPARRLGRAARETILARHSAAVDVAVAGRDLCE